MSKPKPKQPPPPPVQPLLSATVGELGTVVMLGEPTTLDRATCPDCRMPTVLLTGSSEPERDWCLVDAVVVHPTRGVYGLPHRCGWRREVLDPC